MKIQNRIFVAVSQFLNACTGGMPDETLCSRMWRKKQGGSKVGSVMVTILDHVFFFDPGHCKDSYDAEIERRHVPDAFKTAKALG